MPQFLRDRRAFFLLIAVVASLFVLMAAQLQGRSASGTESWFLRFASPFLSVASSVTGGGAGVWDEYVNLRHTRARNASLEEKVGQLEMELKKLEEARIENDRLRALLDLKEGMGISTVPSRVIGNNSTGLSRTLLVNRGSDSGVKPNMAVVGSSGVVGRVWTVSPGLSKVQLLTDAAAGTAVLLQRTRVQGILMGGGTDLCTLEYISTLEDVKEGDLVITSGLDGIYPKGLPVGRVGKVSPGEGIFWTIAVIPRVEFNRLEEVLILLRSDIPLPEPPPVKPAAPAAPRPPAKPSADAPGRRQ
ncbi:MAG TPA: rod shape-determining protein MreC [Patescibacteria group bacterium]|nr:rod shape-determining protein MreC [Patescibacteria group bacterium]